MMAKANMITSAVAGLVTPDVAREIAEVLVNAARNGDAGAIREVMTMLANDPIEGCDHPHEARQSRATMGGGPVIESCSQCGIAILNGSEVA
jgi:hypothetical protein